jgi:amidohydrolase
MEYKTREKVSRALKDAALSAWEPRLGTDFIGELKGRSERVIVLRADIDALPVEEKTGLPYRSKNAGVMHACGHDGHTAVLAGAALVLSALKEHLPVTVRFVFQPGEEKICAGRDLVEKGACEGAEAAYALHSWPSLPLGAVACKEGTIFACGSQFRVLLHGKGCHGASPEKGLNPIPVGAEIIQRLFALHRAENPVDSTVVSSCHFEAGTSPTIIPDTALLEGTARYLSAEKADLMQKKIEAVIEASARGTGVTPEVSYDRRYSIPVINSRKGFEAVRRCAETVLPAGAFRVAEKPSMGMEDFSFYLPGREGAMFWLGMGEHTSPIHSSLFDFNDNALEPGILMMCALVLDS